MPRMINNIDKWVKTSRPVSPYRDAQFMRNLEGIVAASGGIDEAMTSVCTASMDSHSLAYPLQPYPSVSERQSESPRQLASTSAVPLIPETSPSSPRSRVLPWWHGKYLNDPVRSHRLPADWRDTSDILRCHYGHVALAACGLVHTFTLRLRHDIEARARAKPNPMPWLQKRIDRELHNALNRPVEFILTLEEDDKRQLHCHGELQIDQVEAATARAALRRAGGLWRTTRQHQVKTVANPNDGWTGYISKDFWKVTPMMRKLLAPHATRLKVTFDGPALSITAKLNASAKRLYEQHRDLVIDEVSRRRRTSRNEGLRRAA